MEPDIFANQKVARNMVEMLSSSVREGAVKALAPDRYAMQFTETSVSQYTQYYIQYRIQ